MNAKVMDLNKKKIILSVAGIILLKLGLRLLSYHLVNRLTKILKKNHNVFFRIEKPRLRGMRRFVFNKIYIKTGGYRIIISNGSITINLHSLIHNGSFHKIVEIFDLREVFFHAIASMEKKDIQLNSGSDDRFSFERKYYSFFRKSIEKFWRLSLTGNIQRTTIVARFHNKTVNLFFKDLGMIGNSIKGHIEIGIKNYWFKTPFELYKDADECKLEISSQAVVLGNNSGTLSEKESQHLSFSGYKITYRETDNFDYTLSGEILNILISGQNISLTPVLIKKLEIEQRIRFTENEFRILKESSLNFDGISFFQEFHHCCRESDLLRMSLILFIEGSDFLQHFPFLSMQGIRSLEVSGDTAIKLDYMTSLADFSNYYFNARVLQNTLKIEKNKEFDISYLSGDFVHKVNDHSGTKRYLNISKANKNFLSTTEIPSFVANIIVATEDPNFYKHRGIDSHFIGIAIAKNIINKKFVKGASTITMQLAKNLFLNRKKTPVRKLEEVVLAWLIENPFRISKDRILEIYLNIIEFGENIYGLSEAARYYFEKKVLDLGITELLVLSYIIPRPKYFLEAVLMKSPKLIRNLTRHIDFYSNDLLYRKLIDKEQYNEIKYDIKFKPSIGRLVLK